MAKVLLACAVCSGAPGAVFPALAQSPGGAVVRDGSVGSTPAGVVPPGIDPTGRAATYLIGSDLGEQVGGNLFHSFSRFGVGAGETATFTGSAGIENVVSRVTGGGVSEINGTLRSTIDGAHVFLLNPAGVVFGAGARLEVPGSFHASTAQQLGFTDGARLATGAADAPILSAASPAAFGFLGAGAGEIRADGATLALPNASATNPQPTLSLVGGEVSLRGATLRARGGRIAVVATAAAAEVPVASEGSAPPGDAGALVAHSGLDVSASGLLCAGRIAISGGQVRISDGTLIDANAQHGQAGAVQVAARDALRVDSGSTLRASATGAGDAGRIELASGSVVVESARLQASSRPAGGTSGEIAISGSSLRVGAAGRLEVFGDGGLGIGIEMESVAVEGGDLVSEPFGNGRGADIVVRTHDLTLHEGRIRSSTRLPGAGGDVRIEATGSVAVVGSGTIPSADDLIAGRSGTLIFSGTGTGGGRGGDVLISARDLTVSDAAYVSATSVPGGGEAGVVRVEADRISVLRGGDLDSSTGSTQPAGSVHVAARESIVVAGRSLQGLPSRIRSFSGAEGAGGELVLSSPSISVDGGAVTTAALHEGAGGAVLITADRLEVTGGGRIDGSAYRAGRGGSVDVDAGMIVVSGPGSGLYTGTAASGAAGDLSVHSGSLDLGPGAVISATTGADVTGSALAYRDINLQGFVLEEPSNEPVATGSGGAVTLRVDGALRVRGGAITSESLEGGEPGSIDVAASRVSVSEGGRIEATSAGAAPAGTIRIDAGRSLELERSRIATEANSAEGGDIQIEARDLVRLVASSITASVGDGSGGNVLIDPDFVVLQRGSRIVAQAGEGQGGSIRIVAGGFLASPDSLVSASSDLGIDGTVEIHSPEVDLSGQLATLPTSYQDAAALLRERCSARGGAAGSHFVAGGREGTPLPLDGYLIASPPRAAGGREVVLTDRAREAQGEWITALAPQCRQAGTSTAGGSRE